MRREFFLLLILCTVIIIVARVSAAAAREANDFFINNQDHLRQINADVGWNFETGSKDVVIAIIDTGVDIDHPDLRGNIWVNAGEVPYDGIDNDNNGYIDDVQGWDFIERNSNPRPKISSDYTLGALLHGTIVAGTAGAVGNNTIGVAGVAWEVSLMPLRALDQQGSGSVENVIEAITYAIDNGADIINLSIVSQDFDQRLFNVIKRAYENNVAVVAAAGNEGDDHRTNDLSLVPHYPICLDGSKGENYVIGVAGVDSLNRKARYSNFGSSCIDISAPGSNIMTTQFFQPAIPGLREFYTDSWSGTSLSTPIISGSLALLKSSRPDISIHALARALIATAKNIDKENPEFVSKLGSGVVSLGAALAIIEGEPAGKETTARRQIQRGTDTVFTLTKGVHGTSIFSEWSISGIKIRSTLLNVSFTAKEFIVADIDADGVKEIIIGGAEGAEPKISIFDSKTGLLEKSFLVYPSVFKGGLTFDVADINLDGRKEIIVAPLSKGSPQIRILDASGKSITTFYVGEFFNKTGFHLSVGNLDENLGTQEILIVAQSEKNGVVYSTAGNKIRDIQFSETIQVNDRVSIHDASRSIVVAAGNGFAPLVRLFTESGTLREQYFAYKRTFLGGVSLGMRDVNNDGVEDIITGAGPSGGPHVRAFTLEGALIGQFFAETSDYTSGVAIGS